MPQIVSKKTKIQMVMWTPAQENGGLSSWVLLTIFHFQLSMEKAGRHFESASSLEIITR